MEALKFELGGKTAFFKKPDVNSYIYFTYGNIHKIALLGVFGSILGLDGYMFQKDKTYPDFYNELRDIKLCIVPQNKEGYINKKIQTFNNSVGYASKELGGNLIVKEQWLEEPKWEVYIQMNENKHIKELKNRLLQSKYKYIPYLGKNDHFASIEKVEVVELKEIHESPLIDSLFIGDKFDIVGPSTNSLLSLDNLFTDSTNCNDKKWKYEEKLPIALEKTTNQYILENFIFTNLEVKNKIDVKLYKENDKILFFF